MTKSETINELAAALAKAQGEISGASKSSENPFFKSTYADLASVWDACRLPLSKHGLAVIQTLGQSEKGTVLETMLTHSSGQWVSSSVPLSPVDQKPQSVGSAITYMRRYSLQAIVGIAPEDDDDDGHDASHPMAAHPAAAPAVAKPAVRTKKLVGGEIVKQAAKMRISDIEAIQWAEEKYQKPSAQLTLAELESFLEFLQGEEARNGIK